MESGTYHMVISDLRMETEEAGMEVIRAARRQSYDPATALLTAYPPTDEPTQGASGNEEQPVSMLIKPLGTGDLIRQIEALLIRHADRRQIRERLQTQIRHRPAS